jgi:hypothetical protein
MQHFSHQMTSHQFWHNACSVAFYRKLITFSPHVLFGFGSDIQDGACQHILDKYQYKVPIGSTIISWQRQKSHWFQVDTRPRKEPEGAPWQQQLKATEKPDEHYSCSVGSVEWWQRKIRCWYFHSLFLIKSPREARTSNYWTVESELCLFIYVWYR